MRHHRCITALAAACLLAFCGCQLDPASWDRFLLRPWPASDSTPAELRIAFEDVRIPSAGGKMLAGWYLPARGGTARATYLVHTSMEGNLSRYLAVLSRLSEGDINAFAYDWQGFGSSEGIADFRNFEPDSRAAVDYLRSRPEASCHRLIHVGLSLGTLPAVAIAAERPDDSIGLILYGPFFPEQLPSVWISEEVSPLLSPFGSLAGGLWLAVLPPFLDPRQHMGSLRTPILVITPQDDEIVPPSGQNLFYQALPEPKQQYLTFGGHTHAPDEDPEFFSEIESWSEQLPGLLPAE